MHHGILFDRLLSLVRRKNVLAIQLCNYLYVGVKEEISKAHGLSGVSWDWRVYTTLTICDICPFACLFSASPPFFALHVFMRETSRGRIPRQTVQVLLQIFGGHRYKWLTPLPACASQFDTSFYTLYRLIFNAWYVFKSQSVRLSRGKVNFYNNQINAHALIGQSTLVYCTSKLIENSRVFWIFI